MVVFGYIFDENRSCKKEMFPIIDKTHLCHFFAPNPNLETASEQASLKSLSRRDNGSLISRIGTLCAS